MFSSFSRHIGPAPAHERPERWKIELWLKTKSKKFPVRPMLHNFRDVISKCMELKSSLYMSSAKVHSYHTTFYNSISAYPWIKKLLIAFSFLFRSFQIQIYIRKIRYHPFFCSDLFRCGSPCCRKLFCLDLFRYPCAGYRKIL